MAGASGSDSWPAPANRYTADVRREDDAWSVAIVDPAGLAVTVRACGDEAEARTYASTVRQHAEWLSEDRFREYYGLAPPG